MPIRTRHVLLIAGAAWVVRRRPRRKLRAPRPPLWPLPGGGAAAPAVAPGALRLTVDERTMEADGVVRLRLTGEELPAWEPGAHLDLVLSSGTVRQYSLCGDPADTAGYAIAIRRIDEGRGGSREAHDLLREGERVEVHGPRNRFPLVDAPAYVFVAGGIGITPILPMLRAAEAAGTPWRLLYGGRSRRTMPFLDEIEKLGGPAGRVTVAAEDEQGLPDLSALLVGLPEGAAVYCCGPEGLMDAVAALCVRTPPDGGLHLERFSPATGSPAGEERAFEVELRRTGRTVTVPAGTSALAALRAEALPDIAYSCQQGFCGTCQQSVLSGEVDHRDELLTDTERIDSMLICVSRARGERLTLDL
ncbi:PDR/VanB family oxidoreductase [Streptomyces sp. H27-D2]|uniref:PDR/VanB family oxidoreductase n=1 Tax=Streptomyces sp. H27-D2 TaxID=3046304 RepID=UPI002DBAAE75|nr:PDR/VanB family oxidoreductase [Streptomyces sp. H27-D2]MEC4017208.1 PDR/VanB family oxidoreductase [Streptomyces sp. H27-D2]